MSNKKYCFPSGLRKYTTSTGTAINILLIYINLLLRCTAVKDTTLFTNWKVQEFEMNKDVRLTVQLKEKQSHCYCLQYIFWLCKERSQVCSRTCFRSRRLLVLLWWRWRYDTHQCALNKEVSCLTQSGWSNVELTEHQLRRVSSKTTKGLRCLYGL